MAGILSASEFLGGPDNITTKQIFPSDQTSTVGTVTNDDGTPVDLTGFTFTADYQTLIVDEIAFNRLTGAPNFSKSKVIGSFPKVDLAGGFEPAILDPLAGTFIVHFPAGMYDGPIIPDARVNVPITVYSLTWSDASTPAQTFSKRWCLIQNYEPGVTVGDPTQDVNYTALTIGA